MEDRGTWPSKFELVKELGLSERTLERKIAAGELRREFRNVPGRKPISIIHPEDAAKLKAETLEAIPAEKSEVTRKPPQGDMTPLWRHCRKSGQFSYLSQERRHKPSSGCPLR